MKETISSKNYGMDNSFKNLEIDTIHNEELVKAKDIPNLLDTNEPCPNCKNNLPFKIKKFKNLDEQLNIEDIDDNFARCSCGKRQLDIAMSHILKIMKEENIKLRRFNLRSGATPLITPLTSQTKEPFIGKNSLIILHPNITKKAAERIMTEVSEVKGVIKGDPKDTVGIIEDNDKNKNNDNDNNNDNNNNKIISYNLLSGSDVRCDIVQSPVGEIAINKIQHLSYLESPNSLENKVMKIGEYLKLKQLSKKEIRELRVLDGTCGNGTLGIFLLKLGVKKVVFNDIWKPATIMTSLNLDANGFEIKKKNFKNNNKDKTATKDKIAEGYNFEVYNLSFEDLANLFEKISKNKNLSKDRKLSKELIGGKKSNQDKESESSMYKFDICILDCFPGVNTSDFEKIAKSLAKDVLII